MRAASSWLKNGRERLGMDEHQLKTRAVFLQGVAGMDFVGLHRGKRSRGDDLLTATQDEFFGSTCNDTDLVRLVRMQGLVGGRLLEVAFYKLETLEAIGPPDLDHTSLQCSYFCPP